METESNSATNLSSLLGQNVDSQRATMVSILSEGLLTAFLAIQKLNEQIQQLRRTIGVSEGQSVNRSENIQESINLQTSAIIMLQSQLDAAKSNLTAAGSGPVEFVPSTIAAYPKLLNQRTTFDQYLTVQN
uniref:Uncharacterized protein n=1 Tax=Spongospora subterranea TaxID=70186 RepID=A0A0H5RAM3_9EUKA|eukprot:CRZ11215.1 hypothetical protein [Spongospora subterranea]